MSTLDDETRRKNEAEHASSRAQTDAFLERQRQHFETNSDGTFREGNQTAYNAVKRAEDRARRIEQSQGRPKRTEGEAPRFQQHQRFSEIGNYGPIPEFPQQIAPVETSGGTGGPFPDLSIVDARTGAVLYSGTGTLSAGGRPIFWIQIDFNANGIASKCLMLGSLAY